MRVSNHAVDSYCIFYPRADAEVVLGAVRSGLDVEHGIALKMVGRHSPHRGHQGSYVLHVERSGIFVLSDPDENEEATVITFLRFYALNQYQLACRLYPSGIAFPPTALSSWAPFVNKKVG